MIKRLIFFASAFLSFALFAAKDDTAVANRKWVREFIAGNAAQIMNDDEIHADGTNAWIYEKKVIDGVITNVRQDLTVKLIEEYGNKPGAIILSSTNPKLKGGNLGCIDYFHTIPEIPSETRPTLVNTSSRHTYTAKDGETIDAGYAFFALALTQTKTDPQGEYKTYSVAYTHQAMRYRREVTSDEITSAKDILSVTDKIEYTSISGEVERQEVYLYKIKGAFLSDFSFNAATAPHSNEGTSVWMPDAEKIPRRYLSFAAKKDVVLFKNTPSILDLFFPRAFAADITQTYISGLELLPYPVIDTYIDSFAFASSDITKDTHIADPKISPSPTEWQDPMRWFQSYPNDPFPLKVLVQFDDPDFGTYTREKRINNLKTLQNLNGVEIVRPYPFPSFREKDIHKYCDRGDHIWGADCKCIICKVQREHNYTFDFVGEGECARCSNHLSEYEDDKDGVPYPTGEKKEVCNKHCDLDDETFHRGWHDVDFPDVDDLYCDCDCEFFHNKKTMKHQFPSEESLDSDNTVWLDTNDGLHHYADLRCERDCGGSKKVLRDHKTDESTPLPDGVEQVYQYVNEHSHKKYAACSASGCTFVGWIEEPHDIDEETCWCDKCKSYCHQYEGLQCGLMVNFYCSRCGQSKGADKDEHMYGYALTEEDEDFEKADTHHRCFCGEGELEKHIFENGKCVVCGYGEKTPPTHRCRYKSYKNNLSNTDENHTESSPGIFPDDPDNSTGKSCTSCNRNITEDIPEHHRARIKDVLGYEPSDVPWCWHDSTAKCTSSHNNSFGLHVTNSTSYAIGEDLGLGMTFNFVAELANSWLGTYTRIAKNQQMDVAFMTTIHYPYDIVSTLTVTQFLYFVDHVMVKPKEHLVYGELDYMGETVKDEESGNIGIKWH